MEEKFKPKTCLHLPMFKNFLYFFLTFYYTVQTRIQIRIIASVNYLMFLIIYLLEVVDERIVDHFGRDVPFLPGCKGLQRLLYINTKAFLDISSSLLDGQCCGAGAGRRRTFLLELAPVKKLRLRAVAVMAKLRQFLKF